VTGCIDMIIDVSNIKRNIESTVKETLADTPVTVIQGARQVGKSTLAAMVSQGRNSTSVTLDSEQTLLAAKENPYEFVSQNRDGLLIIDEIQRFPKLFTAIKQSVDEYRRPGRFLVTGSANILNLKDSSESLAGRAETITLEPFSVGEINGVKEDFVSILLHEDILKKLQSVTPMERTDYAALIECGGYPEAHQRISKRRKSFFSNYISRVLIHDAEELSGLAHLDRLSDLYKLLAGNPSQIYVKANVSRTMGIPESSMSGYTRLLEDLCLLHKIPAWGKNYSKRAINRSKLVMSDTGIVSSIYGINAEFLAMLESGNTFGPLLEAFIIAEFKKQQSWSEEIYKMHHFRDIDGKEVDIILELINGKIIAIEIKASSSFTKTDFSGMKILREVLGERFHCGILLYTGFEVQPFGDRLYAAPVNSIWETL